MRKFIKRIGSKKDKDNIQLFLTTFDGNNPVLVLTPKHPTLKQRKETKDFILNELDDHDGYDLYLDELKKV